MIYTKEITKEYTADVLVVGGGPAGLCAAVSAAREGASVLLVERLGVLGGNLTAGHVSPILGKVSKGTMADELIALFAETHGDAKEVMTRNGREVHIDHEEAKSIITRFVSSSGVRFFLCSSVADVIMDGERIKSVLLCTPGGLALVKAKVFIDTSGDGTLGYLAGCPYEMGREEDGARQPATLEFIVEGVDESVAISAWGGSDPVKLPDGKEYRELCREKSALGELPENVTIVRLHRTFYDGERSVNATQVNGLDTLNVFDIEKAEIALREQIEKVLFFLQKNVPGYETARIKSSANVLGVRETRRLIGDYVLCDRDVETGARFDDAVVHKAWFLIDIHNPTGGGQAEGHSHSAVPYDIPYRCLVPKNTYNLLTAGRCISGTHRAHASYRVMMICMATGEAAGVAAAIAAKDEIRAADVSAQRIRRVLCNRGVELFE